MDFAYNCTLAFLRLAIEQMRLTDPVCADIVRDHHLEKLTRIFQLAAEQRLHTAVDESQRNAEKRFVERATNLLDAVKQLLPSAPPGLGALPELAVKNSVDDHEAYGHHHKRPRGLSISRPDAQSHFQGADSLLHKWSASSAFGKPAASDRVNEGPQRRASRYGTIGEMTKTRDSSLSPPEIARRSLFENSEPEAATAARGASGSSVISRPVERRTVTGDSAQGYANTLSSGSDSTHDSGVRLPPLGSSPNNTIDSSASQVRKTSVASSTQPEDKDDFLASNKSTWAKIASMQVAKPLGVVPSSSANDAPDHFNGQWTNKLSQTQAALNPVSRVQLAAQGESEDEQRRVVWITNLPANYNLYRLGVYINRGPLMSLLMGHDLDPSLPGHSVCIIFRWASEARDFCLDNYHASTAQSHYNPSTDAHPASLLSDASSALILPLASYPLDPDLLSMDAPGFLRRRIKWSRSRLFHDVNMTVFKRDVFSVCGRQNVELFHFYNPGEATAVFSSVKVAAVVKAWFDGKRVRPRHGLDGKGKQWDARYEGVDVSFCKGFEEARPEKLISSYAKNGAVRRVTEEKGLEGLYMGPPVTGGVVRVR